MISVIDSFLAKQCAVLMRLLKLTSRSFLKECSSFVFSFHLYTLNNEKSLADKISDTNYKLMKLYTLNYEKAFADKISNTNYKLMKTVLIKL